MLKGEAKKDYQRNYMHQTEGENPVTIVLKPASQRVADKDYGSVNLKSLPTGDNREGEG